MVKVLQMKPVEYPYMTSRRTTVRLWMLQLLLWVTQSFKVKVLQVNKKVCFNNHHWPQWIRIW